MPEQAAAPEQVVVEEATIEAAVRQGLGLLGATEQEVEVIVEQRPRPGWLGIGRRPARVRLVRRAAPVQPSQTPVEQTVAAILQELSPTGVVPRLPPAPSPPVFPVSRGQDGTVEIREGRVIVTPPSGTGRWPVIRPGGHTVVLVNGTEIQRPQVVRLADRVEVRVRDELPVADVKVEVSRDGMQALLSVKRRPGRRYVVADRPPSSDLTVTATPVETIPPPPITREQVQAALQAARVVVGVDEAAIDRALQTEPPEPVVVARGIPAELPVDGRIELHFPNEPFVKVEPGEESDRVDVLAVFRVPTVRPGDLLAVRNPPRPGRPGMTVTGNTVPVSEPKDVKLRAGPGAVLDEATGHVYATRGGRATFSRGVVSVLAEHTVHGDVDANTGHVEFQGDVVVRGNVNERMRVVAAGKVVVAGVVSGAYVQGDEGVLVGKSIVRSHVVAGGFSRFGEWLGGLQLLHRDLLGLVEAVKAVKAHRHFRAADLEKHGDGLLVKLILERKFHDLPERVENLLNLIPTLERVDVSELETFLLTCHGMLSGLGPLELRSCEQLIPLAQQAQAFVERLGEERSRPADVVTRYVQNSRVEATGTIRMPGGVCYHAYLFAGKGVYVRPGLFRGGQITVQEGDVVLDEVGSPAGAQTRVDILTSGRFAARLVHPGVRLTIGRRSHAFQRVTREVDVVPDPRGELKIRQSG